MKLLARIVLLACIGLAPFAATAGEGITSVMIDGQTYTHISEVHVSSGGRITILYGLGGRSVRPDQVPASFLASWGITQKDFDRSTNKAAGSTAAWLAYQNAQSFDQAIEAGLIREVDGIVYDVRRSPADWEHFERAKVLATTQKGALVDRAPNGPAREFILVFNLGPAESARLVTFDAKGAGSMSYSTSSGPQKLPVYDAGRACTRAEVPDVMIKDAAGQVELPGHTSQAKVQAQARLNATPELLAKLDAVKAQLEMESESAGPWLTSLAQAKDMAAKKNKLILVNFTGSDWCVWCKKLDAEVFSTKQFTDYAQKFLVLVRADFPQHKPQPAELQAANETLKTQFGVSGFPTLVAMKPDGTVVWKQAGYLAGGPLAMIAKLDEAMAK